MQKIASIIIALLFIFAFQSCNKIEKNSNTKNVEVVDSLPNHNFETADEAYEENDPEEPEVTYPKTGNKLTDFLPKLDIYAIQYEAEGDLNNDGLADAVIVLKHKESNTLKRPTLVLLRNEDKSYRLDKVSEIVMPVEYNEYDFKLYDTEDVIIENGELHISLYGMGPSGTFISAFKYIKNDFVLYNMETYFSGAGGRSGLFYDFEKGEITETETNTMKEDEPTTSQTTKAKLKSYLFEDTSIIDFYNGDNTQLKK
ncbi:MULTISPECIES: hypothetical protein [Flavobacterium]|uniref:hypothetical protein n=1 Tax=Flavobacterium TaxID=237 RepID=UPI00118318D7|nr:MULTISPECIES: hypothetical protein [Flavobacterium]MCR4030093.1 hypothetical protein [Flavobacterium panacis]